MTDTTNREAFLQIRGLLQEHDPHGLIALYGGDRFGNEIYGYEATTLLEKVRSDKSASAVLSQLNSLASASRRRVDEKISSSVAEKISGVLNAL
jgi:hypothetical protein